MPLIPQDPMRDAAPTDNAPEEAPTADPQEQAQYDMIVTNALEFMHAPEQSEALIEAMQLGDPVQTLAGIAAKIAGGQVLAAQGAGQEVDPAVLAEAGAEVVAHLLDLAEAANVAEHTPELEDQVFTRAVQIFAEMAPSLGMDLAVPHETMSAGGAPQASSPPETAPAAPAAPVSSTSGETVTPPGRTNGLFREDILQREGAS